MTKLHPTYDPRTRTWFHGDAEAPTLRELLALLPRGTVIQDYYPHGYVAVRPSGSVSTRVYTSNYAAPVTMSARGQSSQQAKVRAARKSVVMSRSEPHVRERLDHEIILNLWAEGLTGPQIHERLGLTGRWTKVNQVVCAARKHGDPRATVRVNCPWRVTK